MKMTQQVFNELIAHALKEAPIEACGYLAEKDDVVSMSLPLTNIDAAADHFSMDPKEQFESIRRIRIDGMKLCAVYHSHPATLARPSPEDIRLAFDPNLSYVIVSLLDGRTVKSFRIKNGVVYPEEITIV